MTNTTRNQSVDAFRLLAALCVIYLHVQYLNTPSNIAVGLRLMSRWAIPFFFIISGYFLALKYSQTGRLNILSVVERLLWTFLLWSLIYIPVDLIQHGWTMWLRGVASPKIIYLGFFFHIWFLPSLMLGYLFVSFCYHYNAKILLPIFSILGIVMALLAGSYNPMFKMDVHFDYEVARTWLSIPFLYIGFLLFQKGYPNRWVSFVLVILGAALQVFEARFLYDQYRTSAYDHQFLIGTIPFAVGMAGLAFNNLKFLQHPLLSKWGSEYSLGIYLLHPVLLVFIFWLTTTFVPALAQLVIWQVSFPVILLFLSLALLILIRRYLPKLFNILFGTHITPQPQ